MFCFSIMINLLTSLCITPLREELHDLITQSLFPEYTPSILIPNCVNKSDHLADVHILDILLICLYTFY